MDRVPDDVIIHSVLVMIWYLARCMCRTVTTSSPTVCAASPGRPLHLSSTPGIVPALFAIIIGIDDYPKAQKLKGAIADANAMKAYLTDILQVPMQHIRFLDNSNATRREILLALHEFANDARIRQGDPILIYFAGHGGTTPAPDGWHAEGSDIQAILPYDYLCEDGDGIIHAIPDRTIGVLLQDLADAKGDNITVILDCCHSGSGTRDEHPGDTCLRRGVESIFPVSPNLDEDIWNRDGKAGRANAIPSGFLYAGLRSHVLMAACGARESALENHRRGVFTKALLTTLVTVGADRITYADLMQRIPELPDQNPQCEGFNKERTLFNARAPSQGRVLHRVRKEGGRWIMEDGDAYGISPQAAFIIHPDTDWPPSTSGLGTFLAAEVHPFSTILVPQASPTVDLPEQAYALQIRAGEDEDLRLYIPLDDRLFGTFLAIVAGIIKSGAGQRMVRLVDDPSQAELGLTLEDNLVYFNIVGGLAPQYGLKRMPFSMDPTPDIIYPVVSAAAHFYWHLRRTVDSSFLSQVEIEFKELEHRQGQFDDYLRPVMEPMGPNLLRDGVVDLFVDTEPQRSYGLKMHNKLAVPLYLSVFYFDSSDLSITPYYHAPVGITGGKVDPPLPARGSLTLGYGAGGAAPYTYFLRVDQDIDVGFLKLFFSTAPVDLSFIKQRSPFCERRACQEMRTIPELWGTVAIPIIQRRAAVHAAS